MHVAHAPRGPGPPTPPPTCVDAADVFLPANHSDGWGAFRLHLLSVIFIFASDSVASPVGCIPCWSFFYSPVTRTSGGVHVGHGRVHAGHIRIAPSDEGERDHRGEEWRRAILHVNHLSRMRRRGVNPRWTHPGATSSLPLLLRLSVASSFRPPVRPLVHDRPTYV